MFLDLFFLFFFGHDFDGLKFPGPCFFAPLLVFQVNNVLKPEYSVKPEACRAKFSECGTFFRRNFPKTKNKKQKTKNKKQNKKTKLFGQLKMDGDDIEMISPTSDDFGRSTIATKPFALNWLNDWRKLLAFACIVLLYVGLGIMCFALIEDWNFAQASYFFISLITTVGYGLLEVTNEANRGITILWVFLDIALVSVLIALFANWLFQKQEAKLEQFVRERDENRLREIAKLELSSATGDRRAHGGRSHEQLFLAQTRLDLIKLAVALVALFVVVMIGVLYFSLRSGDGALSFVDALYHCVITGSSVGFADRACSAENDDGCLLFSAFYMLASTTTFAVFVGTLASSFMQYNQRKLERRFVRERLRAFQHVQQRQMSIGDASGGGLMSETAFLRYMLTSLGRVRADEFQALVGQYRDLATSKSAIDERQLRRTLKEIRQEHFVAPATADLQVAVDIDDHDHDQD
jgi:Ion channel